MKVSLNWLQTYFDTPLPSAEAISDKLTFHSFEIDEIAGDMLDVKVLPNRAADCLSHRGIAKELSTILTAPIQDPLRTPLPDFPKTNVLSVTIEDQKKCLRYMGAVVRGVKVGSSPAWLREALEAVGQRSINNVVDATNYVMLNIGQPLHAFDAAKLAQKDGTYALHVRHAKPEEKITTLSGDELLLPESALLITDAHTDTAIGIAGIKGGAVAEITDSTTDLIIESANFDGTTVRRAAHALKLFTDASLRFQNRPSPELVAYGMRDVLALITDIAGGTVESVIDEYPTRPHTAPVSVSLSKINAVLGTRLSSEEVIDVLRRLQLAVESDTELFTVAPSFDRADLLIAEDLIEEVGRIIGYDAIAPQKLPALKQKPDQARFCGIERMKDQLVEQGFVEVSTQSFAKKGDIILLNPLDKNMPSLRTTLKSNMEDALARAKHHSARILAPNEKMKLFEVGAVFPKEGEFLELRMSERVPEWGEAADTFDNLSVAKLEEYGKDYAPAHYELSAYKPFSIYPCIVRDIAFWVAPTGNEDFAKELIRKRAGDLLVRLDTFDQFEKEGRKSIAFRLVFESRERTLTDEEINEIMDAISTALREAEYEVR